MSSVNDSILSMPALGRSFSLGTLYDCRKEQIIPGRTLWDRENLKQNNVYVQTNKYSEFKVTASDSLKDKAKVLNVNGSLKLSLLSGMLELSGSGKYLNNEKSSKKIQRITLYYNCTTRTEQMTMEQLGPGKVQYLNVINEDNATHVVTEITYGGNAFFEFERKCSSTSEDMEVKGDLKILLSKIPKLPLDFEVNGNLTENEKEKIKEFKCTFTGDFMPSEIPSSYKDAVLVCKELPKLLGEKRENAVPVSVTLYPLKRLNNTVNRLVWEISANLISDAEEVFEGLQEVTVRCKDLCNSSVAEKCKAFKNEISEFRSKLTIYKRKFQRKLAELLPLIKGGDEDEFSLKGLLSKNHQSPFNYNELITWVQHKENQENILKEYVTFLSEIKYISDPEDIKAINLNPENNFKNIICLRILLPKHNSLLTKMEMYNRNEHDATRSQTTTERNPGGIISYLIYLVSSMMLPARQSETSSMMIRARLFNDFFDSNRASKKTVFVVAMDFSDTLDYDAKIEWYRHGRLFYDHYALPSAPGEPQVDSKHCTDNSITIHWTHPKFETFNVHKYEILCQQQVSTDNAPVMSFKTTGPDTLSFRVPNLKLKCVYQVSVRCLCEVGVGPKSKNITVTVKSQEDIQSETNKALKEQLCATSKLVHEGPLFHLHVAA